MRTIWHCFNLHFLCIIILFVSNKSYGQLKANALQFHASASMHGSGDMLGFFTSFEHQKKIAQRLYWNNGLGFSIHSSKWEVFGGTVPSGVTNTAFYFTTAGLQYQTMVHFAVLNGNKHQIRVGGGGIFRYQSDSNPSQGSSISYNPAVSPQPYLTLYNTGHQHTFSPGYTFGLHYLAALSSKVQFGVGGYFQNDTQGDAITQIRFTIGRMLK